MRVEEDSIILRIKFSPLQSLKINKKEGYLEWSHERINFESILGYWKNYRKVRGKNVYYVMLLTSKRMIPITPLLDEYDADEVLNYLKRVVPREARK